MRARRSTDVFFLVVLREGFRAAFVLPGISISEMVQRRHETNAQKTSDRRRVNLAMLTCILHTKIYTGLPDQALAYWHHTSLIAINTALENTHAPSDQSVIPCPGYRVPGSFRYFRSQLWLEQYAIPRVQRDVESQRHLRFRRYCEWRTRSGERRVGKEGKNW